MLWVKSAFHRFTKLLLFDNLTNKILALPGFDINFYENTVDSLINEPPINEHLLLTNIQVSFGWFSKKCIDNDPPINELSH